MYLYETFYFNNECIKVRMVNNGVDVVRTSYFKICFYVTVKGTEISYKLQAFCRILAFNQTRTNCPARKFIYKTIFLTISNT